MCQNFVIIRSMLIGICGQATRIQNRAGHIDFHPPISTVGGKMNIFMHIFIAVEVPIEEDATEEDNGLMWTNVD